MTYRLAWSTAFALALWAPLPVLMGLVAYWALDHIGGVR